MITIDDCEAFCEADPALVSELACRESLTMVQAYALAHEVRQCGSRLGHPEFVEKASPSRVAEMV